MPSPLLKAVVTYIITLEAKAVLLKYKPKIIAVTGNLGKTSTKDAICAVISKKYFSRKSAKSYNSRLGVPLTILGMDSGWGSAISWAKIIGEGMKLLLLPTHYPKVLVLEVGADRPGDVARIARWIKPHIAVITEIPEIPAHVEFFDSPSALAHEKATILNHLRSDGTAVLHSTSRHKEVINAELGEKKVIYYGSNDDDSVRVTNIQIAYKTGNVKKIPTGMSFRVDYGGKSVPVKLIGVLGNGGVYASLAAIVIGIDEKINMVSILDALRGMNFQPGRLRLLTGTRDSIIIDDSYNASPHAMENALNILRDIEAPGRKIACLGDMVELGKYTRDEHEKIGKIVSKFVDLLYLVGPRTRFIEDAAIESKMARRDVCHFTDSREAGHELRSKLGPGDVVLVKGSQLIRMERAVEELLLDPDKKGDCLVRQEPEWHKR